MNPENGLQARLARVIRAELRERYSTREFAAECMAAAIIEELASIPIVLEVSHSFEIGIGIPPACNICGGRREDHREVVS